VLGAHKNENIDVSTSKEKGVFEYNKAQITSLENDGFEHYTEENPKGRKFITDSSVFESLKFNVK
jgi:hypothetical protein